MSQLKSSQKRGQTVPEELETPPAAVRSLILPYLRRTKQCSLYVWGTTIYSAAIYDLPWNTEGEVFLLSIALLFSYKVPIQNLKSLLL